MKNQLIFAAVLAATLCNSVLKGMPGVVHDRGALLLRGTPAELGGAGNMSPEKIASIGRYMDHPLQHIGEYKVGNSGKPVSPWNHNELFHNPPKVAKTLSGTGLIDEAILNVARLHKLQDIATNSRPVDGWFITPERQAKALEILDFVKRNGRLPKNLPAWVDAVGTETGVIVGNTMRSTTSASVRGAVLNPKSVRHIKSPTLFPKRTVVLGPNGEPIITFGPPTRPKPWPTPPRPTPHPVPAMAAGSIAGATTAAATVGGLVFVIDTGIELVSYSQGNISHGDLKSELKKAGIRAGVVGGATGIVYLLSATPHGLVIVGVGIISYMAADYAIAIWNDHWGSTPMDLQELKGILPDGLTNRKMVADIFLQH